MDEPGTSAPATGRRARLRTEAIAQIKAAALEQVRDVGAADVSLRAVARGAGMSPAGLYRYYEGRDALLTALIADAFHRLADHMETASAAADAKVRLRCVAHAYREWSVTRPHEFALVFGNPIPGYAAPVGGATTQAMQRVGQTLFRPLVELWLADRLPVPDAIVATDWAPPVKGLADEISTLTGGLAVPPQLAGHLLAVWGRLHGLVSLEVFGQLSWIYPDGAAQLFTADIDALLATVADAK